MDPGFDRIGGIGPSGTARQARLLRRRPSGGTRLIHRAIRGSLELTSPRHRQELYRVPEILAPGEVLRLETHDALGEHVLLSEPRSEGELGEHAELLRSIAARHVERGIG